MVALDELPEIAVQNPTVPSVLRAIWDAKEQGAGVMLLLCGSIVGEMRRLQMSEEPLYGRFTGRINLRPFNFPEMSLFFPTRNFNERIETYVVLGGLLCSKSGFTKDLEKRAEDEGVILWDAEKLDKLSGQTSRGSALFA